MANQIPIERLLMSSLSTLPPSNLSDLTCRLSATSHRHLSRLASLLSSQTLFSLTIKNLQSLSLEQKSLLISCHLLSNLTLLNHVITKIPSDVMYSMKLRDLDAVLLLNLLCEIHNYDQELLLDTPPSQWRVILHDYLLRNILKMSRFGGFSSCEILMEYVNTVAKCRNFIIATGCAGKVAAAKVAAVVALPSVAVNGGGECVICKEDMREGREVCELPCKHCFHWMCVLRWLKKRDTCPCCRYRLPSDDVFREIERLLEEIGKMGGGLYHDEECLHN